MTASTDQVREKIASGTNEKWKIYEKELAPLRKDLGFST